jgi:hypothetical protein
MHCQTTAPAHRLAVPWQVFDFLLMLVFAIADNL